MSINRRVNKEDVCVCVCVCLYIYIHTYIYIYSREYYSAIKRNDTGSFTETWMDLESILQSEISQKKKNEDHILMHIYGI